MRCVYCEKHIKVGERVFEYIDAADVYYVHKECEPLLRKATLHEGFSPCRTCDKRHLGCHSECRPYMRYRNVNAVRRISSRVGKSKFTSLSSVREIIYE